MRSHHAICSITFYWKVDCYLDCESSDTQHIAHTVRGDCMELHVTSHRNFLNERVATGKQSQSWNRVQLLVDHYDEFRKSNKKQVSKQDSLIFIM